MLTDKALTTLRDCIKENIAYGQFRVGTTYHRAEIQDKELLADGRLAITFQIDHTLPGDIVVNEVRLFDAANNLWLSKAENVSRKAIQEAILYRFTFKVEEG